MMRIHHLNCGTMQPVGGRLINGNRLPFRTARMICHCLLIETDQGLVLVDTGVGLCDIASPGQSLGREFLFLTRPRLDPAETAVRQVTGLGYAVDDVRHIVLTHLDLDHAGGLPDFPKAKVHLHATEHQAAMRAATRAERLRYRAGQWAHGPDWVTYNTSSGDHWFGFEGTATPGNLGRHRADTAAWAHPRPRRCGGAPPRGNGERNQPPMVAARRGRLLLPWRDRSTRATLHAGIGPLPDPGPGRRPSPPPQPGPAARTGQRPWRSDRNLLRP